LLGALGLRAIVGALGPGNVQTEQSTIWMSIALGILETTALVGGVYFLGLRRHRLPWSVLGLRTTSGNWLLTSIIISILVIPVAGLIALLIQLGLGMPLENPQLEFLAPEGFTWFSAISMLLVGGLLAPVAEEVYFRGVLYQWLRHRWGTWIGILISALIFGIVHGDYAISGAAFVLGIILAWIYERSQSLWTSIIIHVLNNSAKIVIIYLMLAFDLYPTNL